MEELIENVTSVTKKKDSIIVVSKDRVKNLPAQDFDEVMFKDVKLVEGDTFHFNKGKCSLDRERREIVCGD